MPATITQTEDAANQAEQERYLTVREVAKILRLSYGAVCRKCRQGQIAAIDVGVWRIPQSAILPKNFVRSSVEA